MDDFFRTYPQWNIGKVANVWVGPDSSSGEETCKEEAGISHHDER